MPSQTVLSGVAQDVFQAVCGSRPSNIPIRSDHPVPRTGIVAQSLPIPTNKFFANFFLGNQDHRTWTHPYSVAWCKGTGKANSFGLAIAHIDADQKSFGEPSSTIPGFPFKYFYSPPDTQSMILSALELGSTTVLTTDTLKAFSTNVNLLPSVESPAKITFPLVQGMGFITGRYTNLQPAIQSSDFFRSFDTAPSPKSGVFKYRVTLDDNKSWLVYVTPDNGTDPNIQYISKTRCQGSPGFSGTIQVAKNPFGSHGETMYDAAAGAYPVDAQVAGSVTDANGQYSLSWTKAGLTNTTLLMFALPHHIQSFDDSTRGQQQDFQLTTTSKGNATAVLADSWTMVESNLPTNIDFAPWSPTAGPVSTLSSSAVAAIKIVAATEATEDMDRLIEALDPPGPGMYFSGKRASKFATLIYTIHDLLNDPTLATETLTKLKRAIARFVNNTQSFPLVYETAFKGIVSSGSYATNDPNTDFGNTYYNDHHFHYGYWIHAAAIIGQIDPGWADIHKDWVNMLIKDACNPVSDEEYPFSRCFDWYHGHSWAHGVTPVPDGKDEESTSEDGMFAYAIKMWGKVIGDKSMEARGNLMLSILARTFSTYFLMESSNTIQPAKFIDNKVTGILFENKCDHTIWFYDYQHPNPHAIQGIHMIPINPSSPFTRSARFVQEEWDAYFSDRGALPIQGINDGWKGIIYANLAIANPRDSWNFFNDPNFKAAWLDDGASHSWYLAYAAGLGGAPP